MTPQMAVKANWYVIESNENCHISRYEELPKQAEVVSWI